MAKRRQVGPAGTKLPAPEATPAKKVKMTQPEVVPTRATKSKPVPPSRSGGPTPRKAARPVVTGIKAEISHRLREIRQDLFGEHGGPELARRLSLPSRTWYNYETGVSVPAEVLLGFVEQTGADPWWVLTGKGSRYRKSDQS